MFSLALTFFLISNPLGNTPAIIALVKDFDFDRQRSILLRESFFALLLALFFQYFGEIFLTFLNIQNYVVTIAGGLLLTLVAFKMIFPNHKVPETDNPSASKKTEPFIVPIATPILSGPGLLAIIMLKSRLVDNPFVVTCAILLSGLGVMAILLAAPYLQKFLGKRGLIALEQVMGMVLVLVAVEMLVNGSALLIQTL